MTAFSAAPGATLPTTSADIDHETSAIIKDVFGMADPKQFLGVDTWDHDMYNIIVYLRDKYHKLHFQVVSTMEQLEQAVKSGYPCLFGVNERDLYEWDNSLGWKHPYSWILSAGHILNFHGIDQNGNWICPDPLNDAVHLPVYRRSSIANSFSGGMIIQLTNFLLPIPPLNAWPVNFNAQNFAPAPAPAPQPTPAPTPQPTPAPQPAPAPDYVRQDFEAEWRTYIPDADVNTGFAKDAYANFKSLKFSGPALTKELDRTDWSGKHKKVQYCVGGKYEMPDGSKITFYPYRSS